MIVQCDQCQTRFRFPDDKVTEAGVRARCTRCQHTFRVTRAPGVEGTPFGADADSLGSQASSSPSPFDDPWGAPGAGPPSDGPDLVKESNEGLEAPPAAGRAPAPEDLPPLPMELEAARKGRGRRSLIANVFVGLLIALAAGWLLFASSKERLSAAAAQGLSVGDISNGLYDTRAGRPIFYVRGEVRNLSGRPASPRVRVEILDGKTLVRASEVDVGKVPTPEDLYGIGSATELESLWSRLAAESAALSPGQSRPFVLAFFEYPPDLGFRLHVTVAEASGSTAER